MIRTEIVREKKVLDALLALNESIKLIGLNEHERIVLLKDLLAHEEAVLERKNLAAAMFKALNR